MHARDDFARDEVGEHAPRPDRRQLVGVADEQHVAIARSTEERVRKLEREHRRLVDDHEVVVVGERRVLVALEAPVERRVRECAMDRHRRMAGQVAHPPRGLARRRAEQDALAPLPGEFDDDPLRVRLAGARQARQQHERPRAHELDDAPLLVRHLHVGAPRLLEEGDAAGTGTRAERLAQALLHLPELRAVRATVLDHDLRPGDERPHRRLEQLGVVDPEDAARVAPELVEQEIDVPVRLGVLEHVEQPGAQALRRVELDAERARDAIRVLEADAADLGEPVRVMREHADDVVAVLAHEPRGEAGTDAVREEEALDLADRGDLAPCCDCAGDALARDRAPGLRPHLAQPLRVAIELLEDVLGAEVLDDRAREGRADAGDAPGQPELDPCRRLRQRRVERRDDELPAVPRVLRERARADELLARRDVPERRRSG